MRTRLRNFYTPKERPDQKWLSPYEVEYRSDDILELMRRVTY